MPEGEIPGDEPHIKKPYVVLPVGAAAKWIKGKTWEPSDAEIAGLEASLPQIPYLRAENWGQYDVRVDHPDCYVRQYAGVFRNGKKVIYINAFSADTADWRERLVVILDGGRCFGGRSKPANEGRLKTGQRK